VGLTEDHRSVGRRMRVTMANTVTPWILALAVSSVNECFFGDFEVCQPTSDSLCGRGGAAGREAHSQKYCF